jgi:hypothetical protein
MSLFIRVRLQYRQAGALGLVQNAGTTAEVRQFGDEGIKRGFGSKKIATNAFHILFNKRRTTALIANF